MRDASLKRSPVRKKRPGPPRRGRVVDKSYIKFIHTLPCAIYKHPRFVVVDGKKIDVTTHSTGQSTLTEAAHVGERGLGQKCSDREVIPLCAEHHRTGSESHHALGKKFWEHYGIDREAAITEYNRQYDAQR